MKTVIAKTAHKHISKLKIHSQGKNGNTDWGNENVSGFLGRAKTGKHHFSKGFKRREKEVPEIIHDLVTFDITMYIQHLNLMSLDLDEDSEDSSCGQSGKFATTLQFRRDLLINRYCQDYVIELLMFIVQY